MNEYEATAAARKLLERIADSISQSWLGSLRDEWVGLTASQFIDDLFQAIADQNVQLDDEAGRLACELRAYVDEHGTQFDRERVNRWAGQSPALRGLLELAA